MHSYLYPYDNIDNLTVLHKLVLEEYVFQQFWFTGSMKEQEHKKGIPTTLYKRPHGCAGKVLVTTIDALVHV